MKADIWDLVAVSGLATLTTGVWMLSPAAAWIVCGTIVMVFGVISSRRAAEDVPKAPEANAGEEVS
ncbi:MAG: hypothetical protein ACREJD_09310 [Phycisphaerales bacterium]